MWRGISLANKCLLLFGAAVARIIVAALSVPWLRMNTLVDEGEYETSRQLVNEWQSRQVREAAEASNPGGRAAAPEPAAPVPEASPAAPLAAAEQPAVKKENLTSGTIVSLTLDAARLKRDDDWFIGAALDALAIDRDRSEHHEVEWETTARRYHYARAIRDDSGAITELIVLNRTSRAAARQIIVNTAYMLSAGLIAGGVAILVFYLITDKIILRPVRTLKDTAELIREGDMATRSDITTGDEFEELSETFNQMVERLATTQDQLRAINKSLDLKLNELAERNVSLYESAKLKGEFLASVSHELRTPMNSIIGFTDLLLEICEREAAAGDDSSRLVKRRRYLENIRTSGTNLLEMINGLLDMAKIEAGKMELHVEPVSVQDMCEGLIAMMRPLADRAGVELVPEIAADIPIIQTDAKKCQQIVFNLLSNAVKFTGVAAAQAQASAAAHWAPNGSASAHQSSPTPPSPRPARVTLRAERLIDRGAADSAADRVRISVLDTGPGIAPEDQSIIFEKFRQLESGHTKRHAGTGLGLAISKEFAHMLQGEIQLQSELGRGSMFSVILPLKVDLSRVEEHRLEMAFRGSLAGRRA
ncbi:MAG: ATP-binding protein [Phycisphaerales bacterium]